LGDPMENSFHLFPLWKRGMKGDLEAFRKAKLLQLGVLEEGVMIKKLIRCSSCNRVIPNYDGYELARGQSLPGVEWSNSDLAGAKEFLRAHSGHPLEELAVEEETWVGEKPCWEPLRVSYFLAGNAGGKFLIQRKKSTLDEPASYEILPGKLEISYVSLKVQEEEFRKQIAADKGVSPLLKERLERFIQVLRDEIAGISPERFEEEAEEVEEGESFLTAYGGLKDARWARVLNRCRLYFDGSELKVINRLIDENRHPPDVLSIRVDRRIAVISMTGAESRVDLSGGKETGEAVEAQPVAVSQKG
jgi:hypothetical protein